MTEQEKNDQEQLEYLKRWQEKKRRKSKKTNVFRSILQRGKEDGSERQNTKGH